MEKKTLYNYYFSKCVWEDQPENPISKNQHSLGKPKYLNKNPDFNFYGPKYLLKTVNNLENRPEKVLDRLHKLQKIQNEDNIVTFNTFGEKLK